MSQEAGCDGVLALGGGSSGSSHVAPKVVGGVTAGPLELDLSPEVVVHPDFMALRKWAPHVWGDEDHSFLSY